MWNFPQSNLHNYDHHRNSTPHHLNLISSKYRRRLLLQPVSLAAASCRQTMNEVGHILISGTNLHGQRRVKHFGKGRRKSEKN